MPANKRKGLTKQDKSKKQAKQDGQKAVAHDIDVPVDEGFSEKGASKHKVLRTERQFLC